MGMRHSITALLIGLWFSTSASADVRIFWLYQQADDWAPFQLHWQQLSNQTLIRADSADKADIAVLESPDGQLKLPAGLPVLFRACSRYEQDWRDPHAPVKRPVVRMWREPSPHQFLTAIRRQFPDRHLTGIVLGAQSARMHRLWQQSTASGTTLKPLFVRQGELPARVFSMLIEHVDSALLLRQDFLDDGTASILLHQALQHGVPVFTDHPDWLRIGATASISIQPETRLRESARAVSQLLTEGQSFDVDLPVHIEFNYQTIRSLSLPLASDGP